MWILNQNKEMIAEAKNMIWVEGSKVAIKMDDEYYALGFYESEERAKEVLRQIVEQLRDVTSESEFNGYSDDNFARSSFSCEVIFEMPEE